MSASAIERAIIGALRSAIRDHGPITPAHVGSAAKRVLGNLRNVGAGPDLGPAETREVLLPALMCRCARCSHAWLVQARTLGEQPQPPERCPSCFARTWDQLVPRAVGLAPLMSVAGGRRAL